MSEKTTWLGFSESELANVLKFFAEKIRSMPYDDLLKSLDKAQEGYIKDKEKENN